MHPANALYCPVAEYVPGGTNLPTNLAFTVQGSAWGATGTNVDVNVSENGTFTDTNAITLTLAWRAITNIVCSSIRPNSNDAIRITYRSLPPLYDSSVGWRLTTESLNERKACLDQMTMTYRRNPYVAFVAPTNPASGQNNVDLDWGSAKANAEANYPQGAGSAASAQGTIATRGNQAFPGYSLFYAAMVNYNGWTATNTPATTNFNYSADYYWFSRAVYPSGTSTSTVFDAYGSSLVQDQYAYIGSNALRNGGGVMDTNVYHTISGTNYPTWCIAPPRSQYATHGFNAHYGFTSPGCVLYRWNVSSNGFRYVP
jgi:hypothetical protein